MTHHPMLAKKPYIRSEKAVIGSGVWDAGAGLRAHLGFARGRFGGWSCGKRESAVAGR